MIDIAALGLRDGQIRTVETFGHNASWFDHTGLLVGWGDLDKSDVRRIMDELPEGQALITISERDSYDHNQFLKGSRAHENLPYIIQHAIWVVIRGRLFRALHNYDTPRTGQVYEQFDATFLHEKDLKDLLRVLNK